MRRSIGLAAGGFVLMAGLMGGCRIGTWVGPRESFERPAVEQSIDLAGAQTLRAAVPGGRITIQPADDDTVMMSAVVRAWAQTAARAQELAEAATVELVRDGDAIVARVVEPTSIGERELVKADIVVRVRAPDGDPPAPQTDGGVTRDIGAGDIELADVQGPVTAETGAGSIEVLGATGDVTAQAGAGGIRLEDILGTIDAETGAGSITIRNGHAAISARTGAGRIDLTNAAGTWTGEPIDLHSGAGEIAAEVSLAGQP